MISQNDVKHIAELARIDLTPEEETKFTKELSAILDFVAELNTVDTSTVQPMTGGTSLKNIMRADAPIENTVEGRASVLREAAPEKKNNWLAVKKIFE